jgi:hypothetical protein
VAFALDAVRSGRVWETTHLGGDRFAANVLALPSGLLYGRVRPEDAPDLADAVDAGRVLVNLLRGRIGLPPAAQAAAAFAHRELRLANVGEVEVLSASPLADGIAPVRVRTSKGDYLVLVAVERVRAEGLTCAASGPGSFLHYRPMQLLPA